MTSNDYIDITFQYLHNSVKLSLADDGRDNNYLADRCHPSSIFHQVKMGKLENVRLSLGITENHKNYLLNLLDHLKTRSLFIKESCAIHQESYDLYLAHQQRHADSRLSDLLMEIIGEYSKILLKAKEIEEQISKNYYRKVLMTTWRYEWSLFALSLSSGSAEPLPVRSSTSQQSSQSSSRSMKFVLLNFEREKQPLKVIMETIPELKKEFISCYPIVGLKCALPSSTSSSSSNCTIANTYKELISLIEKIQRITQSGKLQDPPAKEESGFLQVSRRQFPSPAHAISSHLWSAQFSYYYKLTYPVNVELSLEQLALSYHQQYTTTFFNHHIYYCLEQCFDIRQRSGKESFDRLSLAIETIYVNPKLLGKVDFDTVFRDEPFLFDQFVASHRTASHSTANLNPSLREAVFQYPDIIRARSGTTNQVLHFAPITRTHYSLHYGNDGTEEGGKINRVSLFFFTYCPEIIPRKTVVPSSSSSLSSVLINHFIPSAPQDKPVPTSTPAADSPIPILLKLKDEVCPLLFLDESSLVEAQAGLCPDHPRSNRIRPKVQSEKLNHTYFLIQDSAGGNLYFIQGIPRNRVVDGAVETISDVELQLFVDSILREVSFEWIATTFPSFQNPSFSQNGVYADQQLIQSIQRCDWRSCLSNSTQGTSTTRLCQFHGLLKEFVDNCMPQRGNQKNSTKFLPKQTLKDINLESSNNNAATSNPPQSGMVAMKRDLKLLRGSSSLLLEIWDGKLKNTIQTFIRKTQSELNLRNFLELVNQSNAFSAHYFLPHLSGRDSSPRQQYSHVSPPWIVWKDKDRLQRTLQALHNNIEVLSSILTSERFVTREIRQFFDLGCFPNQEIVIIKKEMKQFKDYQQKLLQESEISSAMASELQPSENDREKEGTNKVSSAHSDPLQMIQSNHETLYQILLEENKLLDRKLYLFSQRRQVEFDVKQTYVKKMMKLKALEEAEAKDPNSFKNQFSR